MLKSGIHLDPPLASKRATGEGGWDYDHAPSIQQTGDDEYIVAGYSDSTDIPGVTNHICQVPVLRLIFWVLRFIVIPIS